MPQSATDMNKQADEQRVERIRRNQAIIDLLESWDQEDAEEQHETLRFLMQALDEDRMSSRKLFS